MITINLDNKTERKFNQLLNAMGMKYNALIDSMHNYRIQELKKGITELKKEFNKYESKYNISSKLFYKKYMNGEFEDESDNTDFIIWSGEYESYLEFVEELDKLR